MAEKGVSNISLYDVSATHPSYLVAEAFRCSHLVFAAPTYNAGIFTNMENLLLDLKAHNLQNRTVALIENGSWAAVSANQMKAILGTMKNITVLDDVVSIKSTVKEENYTKLGNLACTIVENMA